MIKTTLKEVLQDILREYAHQKGFSLPAGFQVELDLTRDPGHGDLTTPVAFRLAKLAKASPARIADDLLLLFEKEFQRLKDREKIVKRWEAAGAGYINFFVPPSRLAEILVEIHHKDKDYGKGDLGEGKKVLIEYVSANPTGPLTIAHGRQAVVGDALARILIAAGFKVTREYYLNDTGRQIDLLGESEWAHYQKQCGKEAEIPEEGYHGFYMADSAGLLKKQVGESLLSKPKREAVKESTEFAVKDMLERIKKDLKEMRIEFDSYVSERELRKKNRIEQTLEFLKNKELIYEKEGALWFRSTQYGDDKDRVLRKSTGEYTYLAPDIAYHRLKFEHGYDQLINLWGPDHHGYISRLKAACQALGHPSDQLKVLIVQLVTLYRQGQPVRMSKRTGEFVTLRELFEEAGVDATRFFFLLRRVESHLDFDLDLAKTETEENPVYYLQYAHVRISSILKFAKRKIDPKVDLNRLGAPEETELAKKLQEYPQVLANAVQALEPYRVVDYLRELATQFHKFYTLHRVVTEDEELTEARLLLVDAVRIVLRNGLSVLGVSHPEKM